MRVSAVVARRRVRNITIDKYSFKCEKDFMYLGSSLNYIKNMPEEIKRIIMAGNRAYFANITLLKSKLLSKTTKMKLYKTIIRSVVCYGAETWTWSKADFNSLMIFERKTIRKMYRAVNEEGRWIQNNIEIEEILENEKYSKIYKVRQDQMVGYVERMNEKRMLKSIMLARMEGTRRRGRPRNR
jgi:hypothetical protein